MRIGSPLDENANHDPRAERAPENLRPCAREAERRGRVELPGLIQIRWHLSRRLENHLIEHAERRFLAWAVEPPFRDATAQRLQLPAVRLVLHQCGLTQPVLAEP
jgi:hypothetical protein